MDGNLTEKQAEVLACVRRMLSENGYCPTVREICVALSLSSPSSVHFHLRALERKGYIRRDPLRPRTIEIVEKKGAGRRDFVRVPVIGTVAAGQPLLAEENVDGFFSFPEGAVRGQDLFMLKVKGDSMVKAGIYNGDKIIVERCETAADGDIVVALVDDSATVKRFFREGGRYRLQPENDSMDPILVDHVEIQGKVIGLLRSMR